MRVPASLSATLLVLCAACAPSTLGRTDAGAPPDLGVPGDLGGMVDAGLVDAGLVDAIVEDGALASDADVAPEDAAIDAGAVGACTRAGGAICGVDVGGDPAVLYTCRDGAYVPLEACAEGCDRMPPGVPDRCLRTLSADALPASLVDALDAVPYVEGRCTDVVHPGWPYEARRCTYSAGGLTTTVVTATPSPRRVARWIVNTAGVIPALEALAVTDRASYERGLVIIATHLMNQSSRIFPLEGGIIENITGSYVDYPFRMGVTDGCSTGCFCRINSLHRTDLCAFEDAMGRETEADCLARVGTRGLTDAWGAQCQGNHEAAWSSDVNVHFRALAWRVQRSLAASCGRACTAAEVLAALRAVYG